ncbi:MAG: hypothetical protein WCP79_04180 [Bacillota bacterium]
MKKHAVKYFVELTKTKANLPRILLITLFVACFVVFGSDTVVAIDKTSVEIDVQNFIFDYQESGGSVNTQTLNSQENGLLNGIRLSYMRVNPDSDRDFRINAFISQGKTNYTGNYPNAPATGVSNNLMLAIEVLTMYDYIKIIESQLYFGLGYKRWQLGMCSASNGAGMEQVYSWLYVPVGLRHSYEFTTDLNCEIDFSARLMLASNVSASNILIDGQSYSINATLGSQFGIDLRVPFTYKLDKKWALVATPWTEYSQIGAGKSANISGTTYQVIAPSSATWQFGADFGVRYNF